VLADQLKADQSEKILFQLCEMDFHLQHKVRPKPLLHPEPEKQLRNTVVDKFKLDHHRFRYSMLSLGFDWNQWQTKNQIQRGNFLLVIQYSGTDFPEIIQQLPEFQLQQL
jgi:hypothetical protein